MSQHSDVNMAFMFVSYTWLEIPLNVESSDEI